MSNPSFFNKNLTNFLTLFQPNLPQEITNSDPTSLSFCQTEKGEINLKKGNYFFHSSSGAIEESVKWISQLPLKDKKLLYIYGLGLGYAYYALEFWLEKEKESTLVFLEDDLSVLHRFLENRHAQNLLADPQVHICYVGNSKENENLFRELAWFFVGDSPIFTQLPSHSAEKQSLWKKLKNQLSSQILNVASTHASTMQHGRLFYENYYSNLLHLSSSVDGNALFGRYHNVPAIICGAGPSLEKQLSNFPSDLHQRALIFSAGSSLTALSKAAILPHFSVAIDPTPDLEKQLSEQRAFETALLYRNRIFHNTLSSHHGPHIHITGSGRYLISEWFEKQLGIKDSVDIMEGTSVSTFSLSIATAMGCNPIIFIGMDLAYTKGKLYAEGINSNQSQLYHPSWDAPLAHRDIFDQPILTRWDWLLESQWINDFAMAHPKKSFINATEGGIGFPSITNLPFEEVIKKQLKKKFDYASRVHSDLQLYRLTHLKKQDVKSLMEKMAESLLSTISFCQKVITMIVVESRKETSENRTDKILGNKEVTQMKKEIEGEVAYKYIVWPLLHYFVRTQAKSLYKISRSNLDHRLEKLLLLELETEKVFFIHKAATTNYKLIKKILKKHN